MKLDKKILLKNLILGIILLIIPFCLGLPFAIIYQNSVYLEVILIIFGLLEILVFLHRDRKRDSINYKKNKSIYEDKTTEEYRAYKKSQIFILIVGLLSIGCSVLVFYISKLA
jgi:hypothetical protein